MEFQRQAPQVTKTQVIKSGYVLCESAGLPGAVAQAAASRLLLCREKKKKPKYQPAPAGSLQQVPADWAHGDPVRAARMCVLFARINVAAMPDVGPEVLALINSTDMLLQSAARYLQQATASRLALTAHFPELRARVVEVREQLARTKIDDFPTLSHLEQQLWILFTALASEEVS